MTRKKLWIDIETYSTVDLRKVSAYRYVEDPEFQILMAAWSNDGMNIHVAFGEDVLHIPGLFDPEVLKVAHNAGFERVCFSAASGLEPGEYLDPRQYHCTQAVAGEYGYPQKLEHLAPALGAPPKDTAGTALINWFCKPDRNGNRRMPEDHPEKWKAFVDYCIQDVDTLIGVDQILGDFPTRIEHEVWIGDQQVNDLGIPIDVPLAALASQTAEDNRMPLELEFHSLTGVINPNSNPQLKAWVDRAGLEDLLPNFQAETVEAALASELHPNHRAALEIKQDLALVAAKKYVAALSGVSPDGRLRGSFRFFGAHTGRWAGRGIQPQNFPRESFLMQDPKTGKWVHDEAAENAAILDLHLGLGADSLELKKLVRAMLLGPFTVVDYAAIEARVVAWLAGELWALKAFAAGRDIYVETGQRMGGMSRSEGKIAVLALGYNGGINSLRAMGAVGDDEHLDTLVQQWRRANSKIVQMWRTMQDAIPEGGPVGDHIEIVRRKGDMEIRLPSGRAIHYHNVRWERYTVPHPIIPNKRVRKEGWRYDDPKRPGQRIGTYGGRLVENVTQAVARDIMAEAIVRLQRRGFDVSAHIHDEIVVDGTHDVEMISEVMTKIPKWAKGLPIDGEGFNCNRYRKG